MAIELSTGQTIPSVTFNRIHLTKLEIIQPIVDQSTDTPPFMVTIEYRKYGQDTNGVRYYSNDPTKRIHISDYISAATDVYSKDNTDPRLSAFDAIQHAIAKFIEEHEGAEATVI